MRPLRRALSNSVRALGWDLKRYNIETSEWVRLAKALDCHGVSVAVDVGANIGQFAADLRRSGFKGKIISFEPLSAAHAELTRRASDDPNWIVAPRIAISDQAGIRELHISENSVSSSLLPITPTHLRAAPISNYTGQESVRCARLDEIATEYLDASDLIFLKVDVQGFEAAVLRGAEALFPRIACLKLELSLAPLYEGQPLYAQLVQWIEAQGYQLWGFEPGFVDPHSGRMLQVDGLFCRAAILDHPTSS